MGSLWAGLGQDMRHAVRVLRKHPAFSGAVVATIALAVGANAAVFSVVQAALLKPLPFAEPDRLVQVWKANTTTGRVSEAAYPEILDYRERARTLSGVAGYHGARVTLATGDDATVLPGAKVTANFFDVLGVRAAVGRTFVEGEDRIGAARVALLSHGAWRRVFDADPAVIGRVVRLDGEGYTIAGVLPADFHFAATGSADVYVPIDRAQNWRESRTMHWIKAVARLAPGAELPAARAELTGIMRAVERETGANVNREPRVRALRDDLVGPVRPLLLTLYGAAAFVLLVACANVTNLLLMRGAARQRELGVRAALGAGRGRIVRQVLTESVLLAVTGGLLGLVVAALALRGLLAAIPPEQKLLLPYLAGIGVDLRVAAYAFVLSLAAGALAGLVPALRGSAAGLAGMLRQGGGSGARSGKRLRHGLVVTELALTVVLVSGAALFAASLARLLAVDAGVRADQVLTMQVPLPRWQYTDDAMQRRFYLALEERLRALPGVTGVGAVSKLPLEPGNSNSYQVSGEPEPSPGTAPSAMWRVVNADYFSTMGIPLVAGRLFTAADDSAAAPVTIINRAMAREAFGDRDPVGRTLVMSGTEVTIVGVVGDVAIDQLDARVPATTYFSWLQDMDLSMRIAVRATGDPRALAASIRGAVRELDPSVSLYQLYTMDQRIGQSQSVFLRRYPLVLIGSFAVLALVLAIVGTYGVLSYSVTQRMREMGIRLALGARPGSIRAMVLGQAARLAAWGLGAGLVIAVLLARVAAGLLYGVDDSRPVIFGSVALVLALTTLAAALLPAMRAARTNPLVAIKED